jgi:dihydrolipoamide dehydrogenase
MPTGKSARSFDGNVKPDLTCQLLVLGGGPGGYSAAFRAADLGLATVLVDRSATLGGVCLNVGCIPSKALLHAMATVDAARGLSSQGIVFEAPQIDVGKLAARKDAVVRKLTDGLAAMARARNVKVLQGTGRFLDPHHLEVSSTAGSPRIVRFQSAVIAAGSEAATLPFIPSDPRIVDSTGALELRTIPKKMLVLGGGIIGLEMATVYSVLGARIDIVEMLDRLMPGADRDLVAIWQKKNAPRFDRIMLKAKAVAVEARSEAIFVKFAGEGVPDEPQPYDLVLVAVGRRPNGKSLAAEAAGVIVGNTGFIAVDRQMRTNVSHIYAVGDIVGEPMLAHKAVHQGHVAAESAAGKKSFFDARQIPSVAYTDPEIAWTGLTEADATARNILCKKAVFPWAASGRALANGREDGMTKLLFDPKTRQIIGGAIVGTEAGDLIGEICLAIELGADAVDIGRSILPHPTLSESIGMAAEVFEGVCTDLLPVAVKARPAGRA